MSLKEDILNEIEITARAVGIDDEKARTLSAKIAMILKGYVIAAGIPAIVCHQDTLSLKTWDVWETPAYIIQWLRFRNVLGRKE